MDIRWLLAFVHLVGLAIGMGAVWTRGRALNGTLDANGIQRILTADNWWGISAILLVVTGVLRGFAGYEKGTEYYLGNSLFILKMVLLGVIVVLEILPMITFIRWRIQLPKNKDIDTSQAVLFSWTSTIQTFLLADMVFMATGMARGFGLG
jgi:putative membrane protein